MDLAVKCEAVLCCRVSPKQKQEVVTLVREQVLLFLFGFGIEILSLLMLLFRNQKLPL